MKFKEYLAWASASSIWNKPAAYAGRDQFKLSLSWIKIGKLGIIARLHEDGNLSTSYPKWRIGPKQEFMYSIEFVWLVGYVPLSLGVFIPTQNSLADPLHPENQIEHLLTVQRVTQLYLPSKRERMGFGGRAIAKKDPHRGRREMCNGKKRNILLYVNWPSRMTSQTSTADSRNKDPQIRFTDSVYAAKNNPLVSIGYNQASELLHTSSQPIPSVNLP